MIYRLLRLPPFYWTALLFFIAFNCFGVRPLADPDEGRYAEVAREMAASGDWLIPRLGGREHMTKPPFTYWITALGLKIFGVNEWGARFFLACACLGTMLLAAELARTWGWSREASRAAALIYGTSALVFACGHFLTTDMFLTFWNTLGLLAAWKVWLGRGSASRWRWTFWLAFAMAFLTKGPPGWIPLAAVAIISALRPNQTGRLWSPVPFAAFLLLSASWYVAVIMRDPARAQYFFLDETVNRVFTGAHRRNNPFWMYPPLILAGVAPWAFLWPGMFRRAWARLKPGWRGLNDLELFSLVWFGSSLIIFTIAKSRMPLYPVPMMLAPCLWMGRLLVGALEGWRERPLPRGLAGLGWVVGGLWVMGMVVWTVAPEQLDLFKTYRQIAIALRDRPELGDPRARLYWIGDSVHHSAAFYLGKPTGSMDDDSWKDIPGVAASLAKKGELPILLLRASRLERFKVSPERWGTVLTAGRGAAIIYRLEKPSSEPAPGAAPAGESLNSR